MHMVHSCHFLFDHFQFTLIHGTNIPDPYTVLFFTTSGFTFTTRHIHNCVSFLLWPSCFILSGELLVITLCSSPVAYWTPSNLRGLSSGVISLCLFILFMVFSQQESLRGLPFPLPVDHILSELFTMTHPSWVALHSMAHSFIELHKPLHHYKAVIHRGEGAL